MGKSLITLGNFIITDLADFISIFHGLKLLKLSGGGAYGDVYYCEDISGKKMVVRIVSQKKLGDSWKRELRGVIKFRKFTENVPGLLHRANTLLQGYLCPDTATEDDWIYSAQRRKP